VWIAEGIATVGAWAVSNRTTLGFAGPEERGDMAGLVATHLMKFDEHEIRKALTELFTRQHNSHIPLAQREEFTGICQRIRGTRLGFNIDYQAPPDNHED
jgi:hypothetical protein